MIPELGHYALVLALFLAVVQSTLPLIGAARHNVGWMELARSAAQGQLLLIGIAFLALMQAYVVSDFSVLNVAQNSNSAKPLLYKISGVWGNHEGSLLLWVLMLALFGAAVAVFGNNLPLTLRARVLAVQGMIGVGFLLFMLGTSNPFQRLYPAPIDGRDLNPLLQDPGLAFHPPFLYFGYVGFSMAFSFAVAALIEGRVDPAWARWVRPWTMAAWCGLTLGIALGSWWAYYELGWGGWWFWDPVENASLMPWLAGTALLHSAIVVEKRDALKSWTILLAILTFALSLMGTFLVRSGVLTSVHAFAVDPARGVFILLLLTVAVGGSLLLYAIRAPSLQIGGLFAPLSREGSLVLNNLLLSTATATVFLGTLYPLFLDGLDLGKVSVGPPFFHSTFVPLMVPLIMAMAVGPMLAWKRGDLPGALGRLKMAAALTALVILATLYLRFEGPALALLGVGLASWAIFGALTEFAERIALFRLPFVECARRGARLPRSAWGVMLGHAGLGLTVAGITGSTAWQSEAISLMRPGETVEIAGYSLRLEGLDQHRVANYESERATFTVIRNEAVIAHLYPEKRFYPVARMPTTEAAIRTDGVSDLYVALGDPDGKGAWTVRAYHHPLVGFIWYGAVVMAFGGMLSLSDRRLRIGAPTRTRRLQAAALPAE